MTTLPLVSKKFADTFVYISFQNIFIPSGKFYVQYVFKVSALFRESHTNILCKSIRFDTEHLNRKGEDWGGLARALE